MDEGSRERLAAIWRQRTIPVLYRRGRGHQLLFGFTYSLGDNWNWLMSFGRRIPRWSEQYKCWTLPAGWFNPLVSGCLHRFGSVYIIQPYREQEKCAPACWHAVGHECECSCMGANHGSGQPDGNWKVVSDAFATRWNEQELACRLITKAQPASPRVEA